MQKTILVIDDNESVRATLHAILTMRGFAVLLAHNGGEALELAACHSIDAALTDFDMPGMKGIELCRALRKQSRATDRPIAIWVMTGLVRPELSRAALTAGAVGILRKPFGIVEISNKIERHLGKRHRDRAWVNADDAESSNIESIVAQKK